MLEFAGRLQQNRRALDVGARERRSILRATRSELLAGEVDGRVDRAG